VENSRCELGDFCDPNTDTCEPGCSGGTGGPNCPDEAPNCDPSQGPNGTCVACILGQRDCPATNICVQQGNATACVPGCTTDDDCHGAANGDVYCNPNMGSDGQCVQCTRDAECPTHTFCDMTTGNCRCHGTGEGCSSSADCGYEVNDGVADCNAIGAECINVVRCSASPHYTYQVINQICSQTAQGLPEQCPPDSNPADTQCPQGFVDEWGGNAASATQSAEAAASYSHTCVPLANACTTCF